MILTTLVALTVALAPLSPADPTTIDVPDLGGQVQEDEPGWDCVTDGNHICGPENPWGKPAGCYDDGGVLVAAWPCYIVLTADGNAEVYTPDAR